MVIFKTIMSNYPVWTSHEMMVISIVLLSTFIFAMVLLCTHKIIFLQAVTGLLLSVYMILVLGTTLFTRTPGERQYQLELFWSWKKIMYPIGRQGAVSSPGLLVENFLNILLLFPVGVLLPLILRKNMRWWQGLLVGIFISGFIEVNQLIFCRGLFELDDIIHNAIGCMTGCVMVCRWKKKVKYR